MQKIDHTALHATRGQILTAIAETGDDKARAALQASLRLMDSLVDSPDTTKHSYAGCLVYTLEDSELDSFAREIDVHIHYNWIDYNRADEPFPDWGATIEFVEVSAVRYFDREGEEVPPREYLTQVAWDLIGEQEDRIRETCTEHGYRSGVGEVPYWYSPPRPVPVADRVSVSTRMAPSQSTRSSEERARRIG